jgi:hypothetical protein
MDVDRSTSCRLKKKLDRGLEALNVHGRRRPRMPDQIGPHVEQCIIAFSLADRGYGPRRISAELPDDKWAPCGSQSTASAACSAASGSRREASAWR